MPQAVFEKIWDRHVVRDLGDDWALLRIDRHLLHDLSGPPALADVSRRGLVVRNPELVFAMPDHAVSSAPGRTGETFPLGEKLRAALKEKALTSGSCFFDVGEEELVKIAIIRGQGLYVLTSYFAAYPVLS